MTEERATCPWCGEDLPGSTLEVHEILIHPETRQRAEATPAETKARGRRKRS